MPSTKYFSFLLLLLITTPILASAARCDKADKSTLIAIKSALNNPPGLSSWTSDTSCCTWEGIGCNTTTGRVTDLTIFALNISAPFPSAIEKLTALQSLNLAYNQLYGPIPASIGLLPEITFLRLDGNLLSGTIPSTLTILDLSIVGNRLTGPLPSSFATANFADIDLSDNQLTGDASFLFGRDKNLNALHLTHNKFKFDLTHVEIPKVLDIFQIDHNEITAVYQPRWHRGSGCGLTLATTSYAAPFHRAGTPIILGQSALNTTNASVVPPLRHASKI